MAANMNDKCMENVKTETQVAFQVPVIRTPIVTRARCYEQFLWKELYDECIRNYIRSNSVEHEKLQSEYFDEFCKHATVIDEAAKEEHIYKYPLYCTTAITLWNHNGDVSKNFRKRYSITRPVYEQSKQFG